MKYRHSLLAVFIGIAVFTADFASKYFIQEYIPRMNSALFFYPYGGIGVFKNIFGIEFSIVHHINRGAAWGAFSEWQSALLYLRIVLVAGLIIYAFFFNKRKEWDIPLALIIAGAAGNVLDYFLYGHVIDMLHFNLWGYNYPVFNLADTVIFIGIAWILISSWSEKRVKA